MVMMMAVVVMVMPMMMVMMVGQHHTAVTMNVEQMVVVMADDSRTVTMKRLARTRIADDERERGHRRKQQLPEHWFPPVDVFDPDFTLSTGPRS